jgi:hypothetical protein
LDSSDIVGVEGLQRSGMKPQGGLAGSELGTRYVYLTAA